MTDKMSTQISTGYGARTAKLFFDGDESKYELCEVKFLEYLSIHHLHQIILSLTDKSGDMDFFVVERMLPSSPSPVSIWTIKVCH